MLIFRGTEVRQRAVVWQVRCLKRHTMLRCQRDTRWKSTTISHNALLRSLLQWIKLTSSGKLMSFTSINHICAWRLVAESELIDCHRYDTRSRHLSTTYGAASVSEKIQNHTDPIEDSLSGTVTQHLLKWSCRPNVWQIIGKMYCGTTVTQHALYPVGLDD